MVKTILVSDIHKKKNDYVILDVRTPSEYEAEHIEGSVNLPLDEVEGYMEVLEKQNKDLAIICRSGNRSQMACKKLHTIDKTFSIEGGISAWKQHGYEIVKGKSAWDLERQVRFVAGFLVVIGVLLHFFMHPGFIYLSGFIGLGLMFAAVTNTCAMGMIIGKMPWNNSHQWKKNIEKLT